jgi:hypothetical protein
VVELAKLKILCERRPKLNAATHKTWSLSSQEPYSDCDNSLRVLHNELAHSNVNSDKLDASWFFGWVRPARLGLCWSPMKEKPGSENPFVKCE